LVLVRIVLDVVRHFVLSLRDRAVVGNTRRAVARQPGRTGGPPSLCVNEPLAECMQPDGGAANFGGGNEGLGIRGNRYSQAGRGQIGLKSCRKRRMSRDGGEVGEQVFGGNRFLVRLAE